LPLGKVVCLPLFYTAPQRMDVPLFRLVFMTGLIGHLYARES